MQTAIFSFWEQVFFGVKYQGGAARQVACELQTSLKFIQFPKMTDFLVFLFEFLHNWF